MYRGLGRTADHKELGNEKTRNGNRRLNAEKTVYQVGQVHRSGINRDKGLTSILSIKFLSQKQIKKDGEQYEIVRGRHNKNLFP